MDQTIVFLNTTGIFVTSLMLFRGKR